MSQLRRPGVYECPVNRQHWGMLSRNYFHDCDYYCPHCGSVLTINILLSEAMELNEYRPLNDSSYDRPA